MKAVWDTARRKHVEEIVRFADEVAAGAVADAERSVAGIFPGAMRHSTRNT